jgi:hypothetical protein
MTDHQHLPGPLRGIQFQVGICYRISVSVHGIDRIRADWRVRNEIIPLTTSCGLGCAYFRGYAPGGGFLVGGFSHTL